MVLIIQQSYVDSAAFTRMGRLKASIKENTLVYSLLGLLGIPIFLYLWFGTDGQYQSADALRGEISVIVVLPQLFWCWSCCVSRA